MYKLLLAIPAEPDANKLTHWARDFVDARREPCEVVLLHVVPVSAQGIQGVLEGQVAGDVEALQATLAGFTADRLPHWPVQILAGDPAALICERAQGFDLLVIGSHHHSQLQQVLFGSTSESVLHRAACPIVVVR